MDNKKTAEITADQQILVDTKALMQMLGCGRATAVKIGETSKARVQIGNRLLWNIPRIRAYLDQISA